MKDFSNDPFRRLSLLLLLAALIAGLSLPVSGQRVRSRSTAGAAKARDNESYQRELRLKNLGKESSKKDNDEQKRILLAQIKEDFEQIQQINNETMRTVTTSQLLDYKLVSSTLEEINKRAKRLKTNLAIPNVESKSSEQADIENGEQLKESLNTLDDLIMSFVTNPLFQNPTVINLEHSTRAGRDLDGIIHLSQNVKKCAERLNKADRR
ncbi:MAG TPA: hypothetical protein VLD57_02125 [Blastocatellia bacterium]|nr:hypothetical protein [Blastocatellia bacterium]